MALQCLRKGSYESEPEDDRNREVHVTLDRVAWYKVSLDEVRTSERLMAKIVEVYEKYDGRPACALLLYRLHPRKPDRRIDAQALLAAVSKADAAHRTLKIMISPLLADSKVNVGTNTQEVRAISATMAVSHVLNPSSE